jgi:hypothetical protein
MKVSPKERQTTAIKFRGESVPGDLLASLIV